MARINSKVRKVVFDTTKEEHATFFAMLYFGFITGGSVNTQSKNLDTFRREGKLLDKLEAIAKADSPEPSAVEWSENTNELVLDQAEYELLKSNFEKTPWITRVAREVVATSDWLASHAPEDSDA